MKNPTGKKELLFEAIIKLIQNGANLGSITVAEIAAAAEVGKGTVYEYFQSKNELISCAVIYMLERELSEYERAIDEGENFDDKVSRAIRKVKANFESKTSVIYILIQNIRPSEMSEYVETDMAFASLRKNVDRIVDKVIDAGKREFIVNDTDSIEYQRMTVISAASLLVNSVCTGYNSQNAEKNAIKLIKKALK